jgi:hypothetical protein
LLVQSRREGRERGEWERTALDLPRPSRPSEVGLPVDVVSGDAVDCRALGSAARRLVSTPKVVVDDVLAVGDRLGVILL